MQCIQTIIEKAATPNSQSVNINFIVLILVKFLQSNVVVL